MKKTEGEEYLELATRLQDLLDKWMAGCTTVEEIKEKSWWSSWWIICQDLDP